MNSQSRHHSFRDTKSLDVSYSEKVQMLSMNCKTRIVNLHPKCVVSRVIIAKRFEEPLRVPWTVLVKVLSTVHLE